MEKKIACLGPVGSYSHLAARALCPEKQAFLCRSFAEAAELLRQDKVDCAVLPIENSTQGGIRQNLDILQENEHFYAVSEYILPIDHRLVLKEGVSISDVDTVYSHEQALSQCQRFLFRTFPNANYHSTQSTSACLELLDDRSAGIAGAHLKREGLVFSEQNIADEKSNRTHFLLIKNGKESLPKRSKKIFACVTLAHRPGTLLKLLQTIDSFGLNLTKIESRPIPSAPGEYRFFIEFEGDVSDSVAQYALIVLQKNCIDYRLLGAY